MFIVPPLCNGGGNISTSISILYLRVSSVVPLARTILEISRCFVPRPLKRLRAQAGCEPQAEIDRANSDVFMGKLCQRLMGSSMTLLLFTKGRRPIRGTSARMFRKGRLPSS